MSCEAATAPILSPADLALAKLLAVNTDMNDVLALIPAAAFGFQRYETAAARDADAAQPNGTLGYVWDNNDDPDDPDDADDAANSLFAWDLSATDWVETPWIANALSAAVNDQVEAVDGRFAAIKTKLENVKRQEVVYCGVTASTGSQISLQTAYGTETMPDIYHLYRFQLNSTYPGLSVNVPTVSLNGGAPVPVDDHAGLLIDREHLRAQRFVTLQYRTAFGGIFSVISPTKTHTSPPHHLARHGGERRQCLRRAHPKPRLSARQQAATSGALQRHRDSIASIAAGEQRACASGLRDRRRDAGRRPHPDRTALHTAICRSRRYRRRRRRAVLDHSRSAGGSRPASGARRDPDRRASHALPSRALARRQSRSVRRHPPRAAVRP
jgi:hypothetical protein